jgi:hypothetical protein
MARPGAGGKSAGKGAGGGEEEAAAPALSAVDGAAGPGATEKSTPSRRSRKALLDSFMAKLQRPMFRTQTTAPQISATTAGCIASGSHAFSLSQDSFEYPMGVRM